MKYRSRYSSNTSSSDCRPSKLLLLPEYLPSLLRDSGFVVIWVAWESIRQLKAKWKPHRSMIVVCLVNS